MQFAQLQYAVEIERCGSITEAARNLFIAQPNLSKSLRELEEELGITIFTRTTRGVVPTKAGRQFLASAGEILQKLDELQKQTQLRSAERFRLYFTASPYIDYTPVLAQYLTDRTQKETEKKISSRWDICGLQTDCISAIEKLVSGESDLAFLCFPVAYDRFFQQLFTKNQLSSQILSRQPFRITMGLSHPLAREGAITSERLASCPQLRLEQSLPTLSNRQKKDLAELLPTEKAILCSDRDSAFFLLSQLSESYLWAPALPAPLLLRYQLCQRVCPQAGEYRISAVTSNHKPSSRAVRQFIQEIAALYK